SDAALLEDCFEFRERERGAEAGDGVEFVQSAAGVAQRPAADHGYSDSACGGDWSYEEAGFVADAAGGVLVDSLLSQTRWVEFLAGVAHGNGEGAGFIDGEPVEQGSHEPGGELFDGNGSGGCAGDDKPDFA